MDMIDPLYVASGFGVGLLVVMKGVGGSSLMTEPGGLRTKDVSN
jgi:hypothetical protein